MVTELFREAAETEISAIVKDPTLSSISSWSYWIEVKGHGMAGECCPYLFLKGTNSRSL